MNGIIGAGDRRWTWVLVTQLLDALEHAGYRRSDDDTHVGQAMGLLHRAARVYAGESSGQPSKPQLSIPQTVAVDTARRAVAAFDVSAGGGGFLAVLGGGPERDRAARCAKAFGIAITDLRNLLGVVDDLTAGGAS